MQIVTVIQAVRMNWLNLKFVQPDNFRDIEPSRKNQPAKTHDKMLENIGVHITLRKSALQENASCNHIIHVVMHVVTFYP